MTMQPTVIDAEFAALRKWADAEGAKILKKQEQIAVSRKDVRQIIAATFPEYRGRKIKVSAAEKATIRNVHWCEGTRSSWAACTLAGEARGNLEREALRHPLNSAAEGMVVPIPPGSVLVEHIIFCGKDLGLRITCHPSDMPKALPVAA